MSRMLEGMAENIMPAEVVMMEDKWKFQAVDSWLAPFGGGGPIDSETLCTQFVVFSKLRTDISKKNEWQQYLYYIHHMRISTGRGFEEMKSYDSVPRFTLYRVDTTQAPHRLAIVLLVWNSLNSLFLLIQHAFVRIRDIP